MTTKQSLPITESLNVFLNARINTWEYDEHPGVSNELNFMQNSFLPQVHSTEKASQKKAKEEERERIVGILDKMIEEKEALFKTKINKSFINQSIFVLQEAIERISEK